MALIEPATRRRLQSERLGVAQELLHRGARYLERVWLLALPVFEHEAPTVDS